MSGYLRRISEIALRVLFLLGISTGSVTARTPNDTRFIEQWALEKVSAPRAWDITVGSDTVIVAIIDTGVHWIHPDLKDKIWVNRDEIPNNGKDDDRNGFIDDVRGWDFVNNSSGPVDLDGHGTHVAGIVAAMTNNSEGIAGVAWNCKIMPIKVLATVYDLPKTTVFRAVAEGIRYAKDNGARVINLSLGGGTDHPDVREAIREAYLRGCVIVAASGNDNVDTILYPAAYEEVLSVGATNRNDERAKWLNKEIFKDFLMSLGQTPLSYGSNYGLQLDVVSPGDQILSTVPSPQDESGYKKLDGTSMAAPHVSGLAALILSRYPTWTPNRVMAQIEATADKVPAMKGLYWTEEYGYGRINAYRALTEFVPLPVVTSSLRITSPPPYYVGNTISATFIITNRGSGAITFSRLTVGGRLNGDCPNGTCPDFEFRNNITLKPEESYNYQGKLTLSQPGNYHFFCAYQMPDGSWNTNVALAKGLTVANRERDIIVTVPATAQPSTPATIPDLSLVRDGTQIYLFKNGKRHRILNSQQLQNLNRVYNFAGKDFQLNSETFSPYPLGPDVVGDGLIIKSPTSPGIFLVQDGKKRPFSEQGYLKRGYKFESDPNSPTYVLLPSEAVNGLPEGQAILEDTKDVGLEIFFRKSGVPANSFAIGETKESVIRVSKGDGYTVNTYLKVIGPDGNESYAHFVKGSAQSPDDLLEFGSQKRSLTDVLWNLKTIEWPFNRFRLPEGSRTGKWTWIYFYEDVNRPGVVLASATASYTVSATLVAGGGEPLDQSGPSIKLSASSFAFDNTNVGATAQKTFTISNTGNGSLSITGITLTGADAGQFKVSPATATVTAGGSQTVTVVFAPTSAGTKSASLSIAHNAVGSPSTIKLNGEGVAASTGSPSDQSPSASEDGVWQVVKTIQLSGSNTARHIAISGGKAYITRAGARMTVFDLNSGVELGDISFSAHLGSSPGHVAIMGNRAYVALSNLGSDGQLAVVDISSRTVVTYVPVGSDPWGIAAHNNRVYVTNNVEWSSGDPATVKVVDANTNSVVATIPVGISPNNIAVDPATGRAYVTNGNSRSKSVSVINLTNNAVIATVPVPKEPFGVAVSGSRVYVSTRVNTSPGGTIEVIDVPSSSIVASIPIGRDAADVAATSKHVFVANQSSRTVSVIDVAVNTVIATLDVGDTPTGVAVDLASNSVYVTNQSDRTVSVIRQVEKAEPRTVSSVPGSITASPGSEFTVSIGLSDAKGIAGGDLTILYDSSILSAKTVQPADLATSNGITLVPNLNTSGQVKVSLAGAKNIQSGQGALFTVTFAVKADAPDGTYSLKFGTAVFRGETAAPVPISSLQDGAVTIQSIMLGDVDGDRDITSGDAILTLRFAAGLQTPTGKQKIAADVQQDGDINSGDAILILRRAAGLISSFSKPAIPQAVMEPITARLSGVKRLPDGMVALAFALGYGEGVSGGDLSFAYDQTIGRLVEINIEGLPLEALSVVNTGMPGQARLSFIHTEGNLQVGQVVLRVILSDVRTAEPFRVGLSGCFYSSWGLPVGEVHLDQVAQLLPLRFTLLQSYPNPFNPTTTIRYDLPEAGNVVLNIYNLNGQLVRTLVNSRVETGHHAVEWNGKDDQGREVGSGVYLYRLVIDQSRFTAVRRMLLLK